MQINKYPGHKQGAEAGSTCLCSLVDCFFLFPRNVIILAQKRQINQKQSLTLTAYICLSSTPASENQRWHFWFWTLWLLTGRFWPEMCQGIKTVSILYYAFICWLLITSQFSGCPMTVSPAPRPGAGSPLETNKAESEVSGQDEV